MMKSVAFEAYSAPARILHWLTVFALIGLAALGLTMTGLPVSPVKLKLYAYHKWLGISVLSLTAVRFGWRLHAPPPPLPQNMPVAERKAASFVHALLYLLLFLVPLSGWAMSSASGFPVVLFGALPLPDFVPKDKALAETLKATHLALNLALGSLVIVHMAAALRHHLMLHDDVLARMLPWLAKRNGTGP